MNSKIKAVIFDLDGTMLDTERMNAEAVQNMLSEEGHSVPDFIEWYHENCAGLCPKCGQNFNYNTCECDNTNYDERFDVLRSIFNENREVQ